MLNMSPSRTPQDLTRTTFAVFSIAIFVAASLWILRPFLASLIWAVMLAVSTWPVLLKLEALLGGNRSRAVAVLTMALLLLLVFPLCAALVAIIQNAGLIGSTVESFRAHGLPPLPSWVEHIPLIGARFAASWKQFATAGPDSLLAAVTPYLARIFSYLVSGLGGAGALVFNFLFTVVFAGFLYSSGERYSEGVLRFGRRLAGPQGERAMILAAKATRGIALGVVGTALAQTALSALALYTAGIPGATLLTVIIFILCLAQMGPILVLLPVCVWLYLTGQTAWCAGMVVMTILAGSIDNVLRPILIRKGVDLPFALIFTGVMGGLLAFGIVGIFVGPVLLAVSYSLLQDWVDQEEPQGS
jgi:predicted PurR-regulated permease PerM